MTVLLEVQGPNSRSEEDVMVVSIFGCNFLKHFLSCLRFYFSFQMSRPELWFLANILHELSFYPFLLSFYSSLWGEPSRIYIEDTFPHNPDTVLHLSSTLCFF